MMENIKSKYFIEIIFSYIDIGHKLKLMKYNKELQKIWILVLININALKENI